MKLGIVGLPNVGKSTLFNAITQAGAESANYPFCTIDPNVGVVAVPDKRLDVLAEISKTQKIIPTAIEFCDIAGLVKGASKGEGLGNQFLSHIRLVDSIVHVVRCFEDGNIVHVDGSVDSIRDIETINLELIFSDLDMIEKRLMRLKKGMKADKSLQKEYDLAERIKVVLEDNMPVRSMEFTNDEKEILKHMDFLTNKPVIYAANVSEDDLMDDGNSNENVAKVREYAASQDAQVVVVSAQIEAEISELNDEEKKEFLNDLGLEESGLDKLIRAGYTLLGLISFLTTGVKETRAWTVRKGSTAPQAAGRIHSDFERGFIRAEVVAYQDLVDCGSMAAAKEKGLVRIEGKEYIVSDGDVMLFRFNV